MQKIWRFFGSRRAFVCLRLLAVYDGGFRLVFYGGRGKNESSALKRIDVYNLRLSCFRFLAGRCLILFSAFFHLRENGWNCVDIWAGLHLFSLTLSINRGIAPPLLLRKSYSLSWFG